jgi:hypothetical protein
MSWFRNVLTEYVEKDFPDDMNERLATKSLVVAQDIRTLWYLRRALRTKVVFQYNGGLLSVYDESETGILYTGRWGTNSVVNHGFRFEWTVARKIIHNGARQQGLKLHDDIRDENTASTLRRYYQVWRRNLVKMRRESVIDNYKLAEIILNDNVTALMSAHAQPVTTWGWDYLAEIVEMTGQEKHSLIVKLITSATTVNNAEYISGKFEWNALHFRTQVSLQKMLDRMDYSLLKPTRIIRDVDDKMMTLTLPMGEMAVDRTSRTFDYFQHTKEAVVYGVRSLVLDTKEERAFCRQIKEGKGLILTFHYTGDYDNDETYHIIDPSEHRS